MTPDSKTNETTTKAGWVMGSMDESKAIVKIQKLLKLANNAGNEAEAAHAANLAQELLAAYNLEMAQIDAATQAGAAEEKTGKRVKDKYERSAMYAYQRQLWKALAEANYCWYEATPVYKENSKGHMMRATYHHYIIGREANVITTRLMGDYLETTINRLVPFKPGRDSSKSWISWKEGCVAKLVERLAAKRREMEEESLRKAEEAAKQPGAEMGITLYDAAKTEADANYLFMHGQEAYERMLSWRHDDEQCVCRFCDARRKQRAVSAKWIAANPEVEFESKKETEAARMKREEKEARANARWWANQHAKGQRHWAKKDLGAYKDGEAMGNLIGLDTQVGPGKDSTLLKKGDD